MATQHEFYLERALEARTSATAATLGNVRDRWLRAGARWTEMAERASRADKIHADLISEKAVQRAALEASKT